MKNYQKAIRYATKLIKNYNAPYNPKDLVHDSFVQYHKYQNTSIFEAEEGTMIKTIKNLHLNNINKQYSHKGTAQDLKEKTGQKTKRVNILISDGSDNPFTVGDKKKGDMPIENKTPESILISKENVKNLNDSLCEFDKKVLDLKSQGYKNREIEDILGTHNVKITKSIKNIKQQMHTKSPFNGCKVTVVKKVKRSVFETEKEVYLKDWEMGENSDYNELYVLMTSKTSPMEGLLIKEKESD